MRRRTRPIAAGLALCLVLGAAPARALDPIDIINTIILQRINNVLSTLILWEEQLHDYANIAVYNRYRFIAFPEAVLNDIRAAIGWVNGIRADVEGIACGWRFSARTDLLRRLYLEPLRLCRPSFQVIWGEHQGIDRDLHELNDYAAVLTANELSARAQSEDTFTRIFPEEFRRATTRGFSPGEANRWEAMLLAMSGQVALANNQLQAQKLLVDELDQELERREERHAMNFSTSALRGLASLCRTRECRP